jgi:hypothetical protein
VSISTQRELTFQIDCHDVITEFLVSNNFGAGGTSFNAGISYSARKTKDGYVLESRRPHAQPRDGRRVPLCARRNGNTFRGFADLAAWIAEHLRAESAVLDGEIACVDDDGAAGLS